MPKALLDVTHDAIELPRSARLTLARLLLDLDADGSNGDAEAAWDAEIRARLTAYDEGRVEAEPYEELRARMMQRFGR